ncbi:MAG: hypothetical protein ACXWLH_03130 [Candidatus Saccharimonadales bacterium]
MSKKLLKIFILLIVASALALATIKVSSTSTLTDENYSKSTPPKILTYLSISGSNTANDLCAGVGSIFGEYYSTKAGWPVPYSYKNPENPYCVNLKDSNVRTFYTMAFAIDILLYTVAILLVWRLLIIAKKSNHRQ